MKLVLSPLNKGANEGKIRLAATLTLATPAAVALIPASSAGGGMCFPILLPAAATVGHVYAGDPLRGLMGVLIGVPVLAGSYASMLYGAYYAPPLLALGFLGFLAYPIWMASDAYATAEKRLKEQDATSAAE